MEQKKRKQEIIVDDLAGVTYLTYQFKSTLIARANIFQLAGSLSC
jgi:hypothetical protein